MAAGLLFLPETPFHLAKSSRVTEAKESLKWLRAGGAGTLDDGSLEKEFSTIQEQAAFQQSEKPINFREMITRKVYLRPFLIAIALMIFQQFCGINSVVFNGQTIFNKVGSDMDPGGYNDK